MAVTRDCYETLVIVIQFETLQRFKVIAASADFAY